MIELLLNEVEFKLGDKEFKLRIPGIVESMEYSETFDKLAKEGKSTTRYLLEYLKKLGLPDELEGKISGQHLSQILEGLSKKK